MHKCKADNQPPQEFGVALSLQVTDWGLTPLRPAVEILAFRGDVSVRISGCARFVDDADTQERIYRGNEILQRLYSRAQDLAYFSVEIEYLDYYDLATNPPTFRHYDGASGGFRVLDPFGRH